MATFELGPVIGRVGGAGVEVIPVEISGATGGGVVHELATIPAAVGETWLVALDITVTDGPGATSTQRTDFRAGDSIVTRVNKGDRAFVVYEGTSPTVEMITKSSKPVSASGHVYTAKIR